MKILSEGYHSTRIGLISGDLVIYYDIGGIVLVIIYKMYINRQTNRIRTTMVQLSKSAGEWDELFPPVHLS